MDQYSPSRRKTVSPAGVAGVGVDHLHPGELGADHGGHDTTHGSQLPEDMTIPWFASGPGIQPKQLGTQVHTMDTAATAAFALGLPIPMEWDGVPVYEAFGLPVERQSVQCE